MTPAEVITMRDRLAEELREVDGSNIIWNDAIVVADWLIATGWVVAPPKHEGENDD